MALEAKAKMALRRDWWGWLLLQLQLREDVLRTSAVFCAWIGIGVIFGMASQSFDFTTSVYFAFTSLSTAGLKGINSDSADWEYAFTGCWCLIGVPIFGKMMGTIVEVRLNISEPTHHVSRQEVMFDISASDFHA